MKNIHFELYLVYLIGGSCGLGTLLHDTQKPTGTALKGTVSSELSKAKDFVTWQGISFLRW